MPPKVKKAETTEAAPAPAAADGPLAALTAREQTIMLQCLLTVPGFPAGIKFDVEKVAQRMGLQNPRSVNNAWSVIKKKLQDFAEKEPKAANDGDANPEEADGKADGEDTNPAPRKRARTSKAAAATAPKEAAPPKPKATRRRARKGTAVATPAPASTGPAEDDSQGEAQKTIVAATAKTDSEGDENGAESNKSDAAA